MISVLISPEKQTPAPKRLISQAVKSFLKKHQIDNVVVSLKFVDHRQIRKLNRQYRGLNQPTTILTFSQQEKNGGQDFPESVKILGDLVICPAEAKRQNWLIEDLIIHGLKNLVKLNERQSGLLSQVSSSKNRRT